MKTKQYYADYCTACGLCAAYQDVAFQEENGFDVPSIQTEEQRKFCEKVCPVNSLPLNQKEDVTLWGEHQGAFLAYSRDEEVRYQAASGGILTSLAVYLLESRKVDAVLQIGRDADPLRIKLYCNSQRGEVVNCAASRYITGLTYQDLPRYLQSGKKYAIIGKPCDIEAITNLMAIDAFVNECIQYRLTFFCAGAPSRNASRKMVEHLGARLENVLEIRYRGNGWPGLATVKTETEEYQMPYIDSWNQILGRDIRKICKFCLNGIGETADLSCGDLWNLNESKEPVFFESAGQNIVFARNQKGLDLLNEAAQAGYIHAEPFAGMDEMGCIQPNHIMKRTTMLGKMIGLKLLRRETPCYRLGHLRKLSKNIGPVKLAKTVLGTVKRGLQGTL